MQLPIIGRRGWYPGGTWRLNRGHPLAAGITCAWVPTGRYTGSLVGTNTVVESLPGNPIFGGFAFTPKGFGRQFGQNQGPTITIGSTAQLFSSTAATILIIRRVWPGSGSSVPLGFNTATVAQTVHCWLPFSDNTVYWDFGGQSGSNRITYTPSPAIDTTVADTWVFSAGSNGSSIWQNGIQRASQGSSISATLSSSNLYGLITNTKDTITGVIVANLCYTWNRQLSPSEIAAISNDPWQILDSTDDDLASMLTGPLVSNSQMAGMLFGG